MDHDTVEAHEIVCRLDHSVKIDDSPHGKKKKGATALLRDETRKQDFAKLMSLRASRILWPASHFRIAQILPLDETCVTCFSPCANFWLRSHLLQWSLYGSKISL